MITTVISGLNGVRVEKRASTAFIPLGKSVSATLFITDESFSQQRKGGKLNN